MAKLIGKFLYVVGFAVFFLIGLFAILKELYDYISISVISLVSFTTRRLYKKGGDKAIHKKLLTFWISTLISTAESLEERDGNDLPEWISINQTKLLSKQETAVLYEEAELLVSRWL